MKQMPKNTSYQLAISVWIKERKLFHFFTLSWIAIFIIKLFQVLKVSSKSLHAANHLQNKRKFLKGNIHRDRKMENVCWFSQIVSIFQSTLCKTKHLQENQTGRFLAPIKITLDGISCRGSVR